MPVSVSVSSTVPGLGSILDESGSPILDESGSPILGDYPSGAVAMTSPAAEVTISISED